MYTTILCVLLVAKVTELNLDYFQRTPTSPVVEVYIEPLLLRAHATQRMRLTRGKSAGSARQFDHFFCTLEIVCISSTPLCWFV